MMSDTIAARATPPGTSALASIRLTGPDAIRIVGQVVGDPERIWSARGGSSVYTVVLDLSAQPIDDCVVAVFRLPHSYTGEDLVEITCHGSDVIATAILEALFSAGARQAEPGEFSRRAFMNGKVDLSDAEFIQAKVSSSDRDSLLGAALRLSQRTERLEAVYNRLIELLAKVDAQIDFGESDEIVIPGLRSEVESAAAVIGELLAQSRNRGANAGSFSVALTGPPNSGKSSLFNTLLRYERSLVSDIPGTTRDYLEAFLDLGGVEVKLLDTAGLRYAEEVLESRGIAKGLEASRFADLTFYLTTPETRESPVPTGATVLHNKCDLDGYSTGLAVSAVTGAGLGALHELIRNSAAASKSEVSDLLLSQSLASRLEETHSKLCQARSEELSILAEELRNAISVVSELLGKNISEDSLDRVFSSMCIGK